MSCSCHLNPPCSYCENMPERACEIKDEMRILQVNIDNHTKALKLMLWSESDYWKIWDRRVTLKEQYSLLQKEFNEVYPDPDNRD